MPDEQSMREKILEWVEKDRFNLTTALIYIFALAAFRSFLDSFVKDHGWYNIYELAHYVFIAYPEFLLGALVIYLLTKAPIRKVWNVVLLGFWLLLVPPIVDYFILGEYGAEIGTRYGYLAMDELLPMLRIVFLNPFERPEGIASTGQMVMFIAMIIGAMAYVALKCDLIGKFIYAIKHGSENLWGFLNSLGRTVLTYYGLFLTYWIIGALQFTIRISRGGVIFFNVFEFDVETKYYDFFYAHGYTSAEVFPPADVPRMGLLENLAYNQMNLFFGFVFLVLCVVLALISLHLCYKKALRVMLKNIRPLDTSLIMSAALVGIASLHLIDSDFSNGWAINPFYVLHTQYVLLCLAAVFLLTQFSFLIDDILAFNRNEPRDNPLSNGIIPKYHYKQLASAYALSALFISFVLGRWTLILAILWIVSSILLSSVIHKNRYVGTIKGGIFGALAFLMGYYTPGSWIAFVLEHAEGEWIYASNETLIRTPSITSQTLILLLWVFIGIALLSLYSGSKTYFYSSIRERLTSSQINKVQYLLTIPLFLIPLLSFFSLFGVVLTLSLACGTLIWFHILEEKVVVKIGFLLILISFSLTLL